MNTESSNIATVHISPETKGTQTTTMLIYAVTDNTLDRSVDGRALRS